MKTNLEFFKLIIFLIITVIPLQIIAQERSAWIYKIATISNGRVGEFSNETALAQLKRSSQKNWLKVRRNDELYSNDILKLDKNIWLRINIKNRNQNGSIAMFPNDLQKSGQYLVVEDPLGSKSVGIEIMHGNAIIQVVKDKINTTTGGLKTIVQSNSLTRALYKVRSDGSGEIFLQRGHLTFPGNTEITGLKAGQVANFQNGQITNVFFPDLPLAKEYNNFIKFNNSVVWKKPFFKRPGTWIGVAAVGIGTALIIIKPWATKEVTGTINVNWGS